MSDYAPPAGNLIQFGFSTMGYVEPTGTDVEFNWTSDVVYYISPFGNVVNFSLRRSPRNVTPLYDAVDFEIKEYSQASSELYAILGDVKGSFLCIDPIRITLTRILASVTSSISANRTQAWAGTFVKTLINVTSAISGIVPLRITATFSGTLGNCITTITGRHDSCIFASTLANVTSTITGRVPVAITVTISPTLANVTTTFPLRNLAGNLSRTLTSVTLTSHGIVPLVITGNLTRTLSNFTGIFTAKHYVGSLYKTLINVTYTSSGIVPIRITATISLSIASVTTNFQTLHAANKGTLSATFINTFILIRCGVAIPGYFINNLGNFTTAIVLRTPIYITGTFSATLGNVTKKTIIGRAWPTGRLSRTLTTISAIIRGTLPISITGAIYTNTVSFVNPPYFRLFAVPSGRLIRTLNSVLTTIYIKVPINIYVTASLNLANVTSNIRLRAAIFVRLIPVIQPIDLTWYLLSERPRAGHINSVFWMQGLFYGKISSTGVLAATFAAIRFSIYLRVPIRIYVTIDFKMVAATAVFRMKTAIGGIIDIRPSDITSRMYICCLIGGDLLLNLPSEQLLTGKWTVRAGWEESSVDTFTHTSGTSTLTHSVVITSGTKYQLDYVITNRTTGTLTFTIGGVTITSISSSGTQIFVTTNSNTFTVTPTTTFDGTCTFSLKRVQLFVLFNIKVPIAISVTFNKVLENVIPMIAGHGHHRPVFNATLGNLIPHFYLLSWALFGTMNLTNFNGPTFAVNKFYNGALGENYPYRSGKYWKLQIFDNNGDQNTTTFKKLSLFKLQDNGTFVNILENMASSKNFSRPNTDYSDPDGMSVEFELSSDTEVRYYEIEGL